MSHSAAFVNKVHALEPANSLDFQRPKLARSLTLLCWRNYAFEAPFFRPNQEALKAPG